MLFWSPLGSISAPRPIVQVAQRTPSSLTLLLFITSICTAPTLGFICTFHVSASRLVHRHLLGPIVHTTTLVERVDIPPDLDEKRPQLAQGRPPGRLTLCPHLVYEYNPYPENSDQKQRLVKEALRLFNLIDSRRDDQPVGDCPYSLITGQDRDTDLASTLRRKRTRCSSWAESRRQPSSLSKKDESEFLGQADMGQVVDETSADADLAENVEEALGGGTPLSWSVTYQHPAVIDLLPEKGAAIDIREERRSLLGWAASSGSIAIFEKLRSSAREQHLELDPDRADVEGNTPFMLAAAKGHVGMLECSYGLQRHGEAQINVHRQNQEGNTVRRRASILTMPTSWATRRCTALRTGGGRTWSNIC